MPHDPALVAETHDWLSRASKDLEAAERLMTGGSPFSVASSFLRATGGRKSSKGISHLAQANLSEDS
jgi:hypothetical protein